MLGLSPELRVSPEWAAWANGVAVRELDFHDTFLAAEYSHPGDNIPPLLAVAQHCGRSGADLVRAIATAYEVQVDLARAISPARAQDRPRRAPRPFGRRRPRHPARPARPTSSTRPSTRRCTRPRRPASPARARSPAGRPTHRPSPAKMAIEAVDRAMRGETAPSPIYEGEDGVIAWMLDGPDAHYRVPLPDTGEPKRAILDTYTKEHSAEYQAQALIDLARRLRPRLGDLARVRSVTIHTSHHTHMRHRLGRERPAEARPPRLARDPRPFDHVHLRGRPGGRDVASRRPPTRPTGRGGPRPSRSGTRSGRSRTPNGPGGTTRTTQPRRPSAAGWSSRWRTARSSRTSSPWPTPIRSARGPSAGTTTSRKFRALADGVVPLPEQERFLELVSRLDACSSAELALCTVTVPGLETPTAGGLF